MANHLFETVILSLSFPAHCRFSCGVSAPPSDVASYYQMLLGVERFRCAFQFHDRVDIVASSLAPSRFSVTKSEN